MQSVVVGIQLNPVGNILNILQITTNLIKYFI